MPTGLGTAQSAGLAKTVGFEPRPENYDQLVLLEEQAKGKGLGLWTTDANKIKQSIRTLPSLDDHAAYVAKNKGKSVKCVIESFRDGACFRHSPNLVLSVPPYSAVGLMASAAVAPCDQYILSVATW
jgi:hypothetical protein